MEFNGVKLPKILQNVQAASSFSGERHARGDGATENQLDHRLDSEVNLVVFLK